MDEIMELNEIKERNEKVDANICRRQQQRQERAQAASASHTAALRRHNCLIAKNMVLVGLLGVCVGVLIMVLV